jgi:citrate lyase beta subunit
MECVRRSLLFVPADRPDRINKAVSLPADVLILELEDGVSLQNKAKARQEAGRMLEETDFSGAEPALRVNRITTINGLLDLQAMVGWPRKPDLLILPKVESAAEVRIYEALVQEMKCQCEFMALIESARGLANATDIAGATDRLTALALGAVDLSTELGCKPNWPSMLTFRSLLVAACGSRGISAIDSPFLSIKDKEGLLKECEKVKEIGFQGKFCIHPVQIESVNEVFSPSKEDVEKARKIAEAADKADKQGEGVIVVEGRVVNKPVITAARRILMTAELLK